MIAIVLLEHTSSQLTASSLTAIQMARSVVGDAPDAVRGLLLGSDLSAAAEHASRWVPVWTVQDSLLAEPIADRWAEVIRRVLRQHEADFLIAACNTTTKDVIARAAGLLDGAMASDVMGHRWEGSELLLQRPMYAGAIVATVRLCGAPRVITVRSSSYPPADPSPMGPHPICPAEISLDDLPQATQWLSRSVKRSQRPDVSEAQVVVSGGRALRNSDDFERLVGGLADAFGGATGSSRALVDAGITPNELQVGQTGKIIAPELYVALGISGAVQHLAGMKNSKVVVAINNDRDAPIFEVADYGWVADVYQAVPDLIQQLQSPT